MSRVALIGDSHGRLDPYQRFMEQYRHTCGLGEMGFSGGDIVSMHLDAKTREGDTHLVLPGNHDNYDVIQAFTNYLVDPGYGVFKEGPLSERPAFYVRGAASIDKDWRIEGKSWWAKEELTYRQLNDAIEEYGVVRPDIMVTHTCPNLLVDGLLPVGLEKRNFRTEHALQTMLDMYRPKIWVFGHFHVTRVWLDKRTTFIALGELAVCDLDVSSLEFKVQAYEGGR